MMAKPVLKSLKSRSYRFVVVLLLLCTLLTFNVGRVYRVEAMATTAAIAGTALLGAGAVYIAYLTLTGAEVKLPSTNIDDWLVDIGRKAVSYGTSVGLYSEIYQYLQRNGINSLDSFNATFTDGYLQYMYNTMKDKFIIKDIMSFSETLSIVRPGLPYEYYSDITQLETPYNRIRNDIGYPNGQIYTMEYLEQVGYTVIEGQGPRVIWYGYDSQSNPVFYTLNAVDTGTFRNIRSVDVIGGTPYVRYRAQKLIDDVWTTINSLDRSIRVYNGDSLYAYIDPLNSNTFRMYTLQSSQSLGVASWPWFPDLPIYDSETGQIIEANEPVSVDVVDSPDWPADTSSDDDFKPPVVPYVQLPDGGNWGFNLGDLIAELVNRSAQTITAVGIGDLINRFMNSLGNSTGDYIYYSDNDNNYYTYYSNTFYNPVNNNTTYNINVGDQQEVIPVDLNTIQEYTDNVYLDTVKSSTLAFGSAIAEYFIFWHNADPVLFYTLCGSFIVILLGAFIGKWGHS